MRRRRFGALLAAGVTMMLVSRSVGAGPVVALPFPKDLRTEAVGPDGARLVVVLFSLPDCPYCEAIRREQLVPLSREQGQEKHLIVCEISITGTRSMIDFNGHPTSESAFAKRSAAQFSPTVAFFAPGGEQVSEPIVGALLADFYGAYLDTAVHHGLSKLQGAPR